MQNFGDLQASAGLSKLNDFLLTRSYIDGFKPSQADVTVYAALGCPVVDDNKYQNVARWAMHIGSLAPHKSNAHAAAAGDGIADAKTEEDAFRLSIRIPPMINWNLMVAAAAAINGHHDVKNEDAHYVLLHLRIRNDDGCPNCRRYFVSFHRSCEEAMIQLEQNERWADDRQKEACEFHPHRWWIDEWKRRRNGDQFQINRINDRTMYNLSEMTGHRGGCQDAGQGNYDICFEDADAKDDGHSPKFLGVCVAFDPTTYCPNNIIFRTVMGLHRNIVADQLYNMFRYVMVVYLDSNVIREMLT